MKYDKSKIMKHAWAIAKNGFYSAAFRSIPADNSENIDNEDIETLCKYSLDKKCDAFHARRIQAVMPAPNFTVRDFFAESLRLAWSKAKLEIEKRMKSKLATLELSENLANAPEINKNAPRRELVAAGKYSEGQKLYGFIITGLGQAFRPHVDMFSLGVTPDTEYVQYAYFN